MRWHHSFPRLVFGQLGGTAIALSFISFLKRSRILSLLFFVWIHDSGSLFMTHAMSHSLPRRRIPFVFTSYSLRIRFVFFYELVFSGPICGTIPAVQHTFISLHGLQILQPRTFGNLGVFAMPRLLFSASLHSFSLMASVYIRRHLLPLDSIEPSSNLCLSFRLPCHYF